MRGVKGIKGVRGVKGVKVLSQFVPGTNFRTHEGRGTLGVGREGWHLMAGNGI